MGPKTGTVPLLVVAGEAGEEYLGAVGNGAWVSGVLRLEEGVNEMRDAGTRVGVWGNEGIADLLTALPQRGVEGGVWNWPLWLKKHIINYALGIRNIIKIFYKMLNIIVGRVCPKNMKKIKQQVPVVNIQICEMFLVLTNSIQDECMGFGIGSAPSWCSGFAKSSNGRINEYGFTKLRAYIRTDTIKLFQNNSHSDRECWDSFDWELHGNGVTHNFFQTSQPQFWRDALDALPQALCIVW